MTKQKKRKKKKKKKKDDEDALLRRKNIDLILFRDQSKIDFHLHSFRFPSFNDEKNK